MSGLQRFQHTKTSFGVVSLSLGTLVSVRHGSLVHTVQSFSKFDDVVDPPDSVGLLIKLSNP